MGFLDIKIPCVGILLIFQAMEKLNNLHVQRADMNRLIMNYLVTGEGCAMGAASWAPFSLSGLTSKTLPLEGPES